MPIYLRTYTRTVRSGSESARPPGRCWPTGSSAPPGRRRRLPELLLHHTLTPRSV